MWRELFTGSPATALAVGALLFFIAVFGAAVVMAMSRKRTAHYERMAHLPVDADDFAVAAPAATRNARRAEATAKEILS